MVQLPPPTTPLRHRRLVVLRGTRAETEQNAVSLVTDSECLWVSYAPAPDALGESSLTRQPPQVRRLLGRSFDAVVLDLHEGASADVLGQSQGFIWGGGVLILRMNPAGQDLADDATERQRLTVFPYPASAVGRHFDDHLERAITDAGANAHVHVHVHSSWPRHPRQPAAGTPEQAAVVQALQEAWRSQTPGLSVIIADRGRGKSSALGLAIARLLDSPADARVWVTGPSKDAVAEVLRFGGHSHRVSFLAASALFEALAKGPRPAVIVIDEAAQLAVPWLKQLVAAAPDVHLAFATTTRGYEGTGRGFVLRFLAWLESQQRRVARHSLAAPIRWGPGDPVERFAFDALLLDAQLADCTPDDTFSVAEVHHEALSGKQRAGLAGDPAKLRAFFGLLVQAHYRTSPGDLQRLLDAPNLHLHALTWRGSVVAATLIAEEGGWTEAMCTERARGHGAVRGHALPDTLVGHLGEAEAGQFSMIRSVRIAVHPAFRRRGLATRLIEAVHAAWQPDLFGTLFGATPELLRFRRAVGYSLVRVSASRGTHTGEPSAMMIRPVSARAKALLTRLRRRLTRDLPTQLDLFVADGDLLLDVDARQCLLDGLPAALPLSLHERDADVHAYAFGARTMQSVAAALNAWVAAHPEALERLDDHHRALVQERVINGLSWTRVRYLSGAPSYRMTMRGLRQAFRYMVGPEENPHVPRDSTDRNP